MDISRSGGKGESIGENKSDFEAEQFDEGFTSRVGDVIPMDRRGFIKSVSLFGGLVGGASSGVAVVTTPASAQDGQISDGYNAEDAFGGDIDSVGLSSDTKFEFEWEGLVRGDVIEFSLLCEPVAAYPKDDVLHDSTLGDGSVDYTHPTYAGLDSNHLTRTIGEMSYQVSSGDSDGGTAILESEEFFENRETIPLDNHQHIDLANFKPNIQHMNENPIGLGSGEFRTVNGYESNTDVNNLIGRLQNDDIIVTSDGDHREYMRVNILRFELQVDNIELEDSADSVLDEWYLAAVVNATGGFGYHFGQYFGNPGGRAIDS